MPERTDPLRWLRNLVVAAQLLFLLVGAEHSIAGEGPQAEPAPTVEPAPAAEPAPTEEPAPAAEPAEPANPPSGGTTLEKNLGKIEKEMDRAHERLERNILEQAIRLDNFFGKVRTDDQRQTEYLLRLRSSVRMEQRENLRFGESILAHMVLSKLSERLRLTISGESEPAPFASRLPEDPGNPGFDRTSQTARLVNTELRYGLLQTPTTDIFLGAGFKVTFPPEAFLRSRYQYTHHFSDITLVRFAETFFLNNNVGLGETTEVALERLLDQKTLVRWANTATASQRAEGVEWGSELSWIHELSSKSAITLMAGVYGNTTFDDVMSNYRLLARYRRNFLRSWLFYELEPQISWPRDADGKFPHKLALTLLLEVVLEGAGTASEIKPAPP